MIAALAVLLIAKTWLVLWLIGRDLDALDRGETGDSSASGKRAFWLGAQEVVWFFGVCLLASSL